MAVTLHELGYFTWKEWAAALASELRGAADGGIPDDGSRYYHHWLTALEHLVTAKELVTTAALADRKEAWAEAYRRTPHGKPVILSGGPMLLLSHWERPTVHKRKPNEAAGEGRSYVATGASPNPLPVGEGFAVLSFSFNRRR